MSDNMSIEDLANNEDWREGVTPDGLTIYSTAEVCLGEIDYGAKAVNKRGNTVWYTKGYESRKRAVKMLIAALGGIIAGLLIGLG